MMSRLNFAILYTVIAVGLLSGCGIKPSNLEPPQGQDKNTFPRIYPNEDTLKP